jgi:hypothetical protein
VTAAFELGRVRPGKAAVDRSLSAIFLLAVVIADRLRCAVAIARSTSEANTLKSAASLSNSSRFALSVARTR